MSTQNSTRISPTDAGYAALTQTVAVQPRADASVLAIGDADRADFLHRLTTNNIKALRPGQSAVTVLTSPTARILFVFTVLCREQDILLLPARGQAAALARHLRGQIFFMDKVTVTDLEYVRWRIMGPNAAELLHKTGWPADEIAGDAWHERDGLFLARQDEYDIPGFELAAPAAQASALQEEMQRHGAHILADNLAYTSRRDELGRPAPGYELTEEYNPLEAGLAWACSDNKGCYTGQEIIARQVTYDKVTKTLVGLLGEDDIQPGAPVTVEGRSAGAVTSAAYSPSLQSPIALAVIKRPDNQPGSAVKAGDIASRTVALPFTEE